MGHWNGDNFIGHDAALPYLGRCRDCDFVLFSTTVAPGLAERYRDVKADGKVYRINNAWYARCPHGHKPFPMKQIKGTYSADHKCDSRCLNAKGHNCTCSCGGMNHGRGHVATVITTEAEVKPVESEHVGEVGKHIRGEIRVGHLNCQNDFTTITMYTVKGSNKLVWFAPAYATPEWRVGETHEIRAKVKKHEEHERFGKSTVVTYVEEI